MLKGDYNIWKPIPRINQELYRGCNGDLHSYILTIAVQRLCTCLWKPSRMQGVRRERQTGLTPKMLHSYSNGIGAPPLMSTSRCTASLRLSANRTANEVLWEAKHYWHYRDQLISLTGHFYIISAFSLAVRKKNHMGSSLLPAILSVIEVYANENRPQFDPDYC